MLAQTSLMTSIKTYYCYLYILSIELVSLIRSLGLVLGQSTMISYFSKFSSGGIAHALLLVCLFHHCFSHVVLQLFHLYVMDTGVKTAFAQSYKQRYQQYMYLQISYIGTSRETKRSQTMRSLTGILNTRTKKPK